MMIPKYLVKRDIISKSILQCHFLEYIEDNPQCYMMKRGKAKPDIIDFAASLLDYQKRMMEILIKDEFNPEIKIKDCRRFDGRSIKKNCIFNIERNVDISFHISKAKIREHI